MVEHQPVMGNLSVLLLDDNLDSLRIISNMLVESGFKVFPFQTVGLALDFVKSRAAIEEELDLVLAEVHLRNIVPGSLANSELLRHILNELQVPLITMGAYDDEEAISEHVALGACSHLLKPLRAGSLNILKQKALERKSKKATPQGPIPSRNQSRMVSSSTKRLILDRNDLPNPGSNEFEVTKVRKARGSKKPGRFKWTIELHEKFLDAIEVLGDKDAKPEGILKLMNVKGLTSKQISSHLQKHRLLQRNAKQGRQHQRNVSRKPVSELIGSAHDATTTESITPTVDADSRVVYPSRLWTQVKAAAVLKSCTYTCTSGIYRGDRKSVWDDYEKDLQKKFSTSNRCWQHIGVPLSKCQLPAKNNVVIDAGVSSEALKAAGEIGYGASIESCDSSLSTGLVDQVGENNCTKAAGINDNVGNINLHEGIMNKEPTAASDPSDLLAFLQSNNVDLLGPSYGREEDISYWMSQPLEGWQNLGLEDPLQADDACNQGLALPSLINIDGSMAQETTVEYAPQEATIQSGLVDNPVMQIAQDDGFSLVQQNLGLEDPLQVGDAWNKGLASPSLINIDGSMAQETTVPNAPQEATIQNDPVGNPAMQIAQDNGFSLVQQYLGLEGPLQVDDAWNKGLASPSLINIDGPIAQEGTVQNAPQEATIQNDPVYNPVMQIAQDDGFSLVQQNLGLEDSLQVGDTWNKGLASPSLINIDGLIAQETTVQNAPQEATIQNDLVGNPAMQIAQDDGFSLVQQNLGLDDPLQVGDAWNKGLASPSLINIDGSMAQEGTIQNPQEDTIQNPPAHNPVKPTAQDNEFWNLRPLGDFDMLI